MTALFFGCALFSPEPSEAGRRGGSGVAPNFVVILLDDMGAETMRFFGGPKNAGRAAAESAGTISAEIPYAIAASTPHLDALADNGIRFGGLWNGPLCGGTRAALLDGAITTNRTRVARDGRGKKTWQRMWDEAGQLGTGRWWPSRSFTGAEGYLGTRVRLGSPEYFIVSGIKCYFGGGFLSNGENVFDIDLDDGSINGFSGLNKCGGVGKDVKPKWRKSFKYWSDPTLVSALGNISGTDWVENTFTFTDRGHPRAYFPTANSTEGFLSTPDLRVEMFKEHLNNGVFQSGRLKSSRPFLYALSMPGSDHGAGDNEGWDSSGAAPGVPSAGVLNNPLNSNPDTKDFLEHSATTECDGFTNAQYLAAGWHLQQRYRVMCGNRVQAIWDDAVGSLVDYLGADLLHNTYIIVMGDNGGTVGYNTGFLRGWRTPTGADGPLQEHLGPNPPAVSSGEGAFDCYGTGPSLLYGQHLTEIPNTNPLHSTGAGAEEYWYWGSCGKSGRNNQANNQGLVVAYGPIPRGLRGGTSMARVMMPDIAEMIRSSASPHVPRSSIRGAGAYDGYDLSHTWGKNCSSFSDFSLDSSCHRLRGTTFQAGGAFSGSVPDISAGCQVSEVAADPDINGNSYLLERSMCRPDRLYNLTDASAGRTDLRHALDVAQGTGPSNDLAAYVDLLAKYALHSNAIEGVTDNTINTQSGGVTYPYQITEGPCTYGQPCY